MNLQKIFDENKCCVLLPTYNNQNTLIRVIDEVILYTTNIIIINDGSDDSTAEILRSYPQLTIIEYSKNIGKGWALRQGFKKAIELGYLSAISLDTDGQHFPKDLEAMLLRSITNPGCLIIGARNMNQTNVPTKSSFGNKFSNFWFKLETGNEMPDTQSGYRFYPLHEMREISFYTIKFEFEIEVLVRAAWSGIPIISEPVSVFYPDKNERISHFRPLKDFTRISILNTVLVFITFVYIKPRDFFRYIKKKNLASLIRDHLLKPNESNTSKSISVALGLFFGIAPFWGFQMILIFIISKYFKLNTALSLIVSNISFPPFIPLIIYFSYKFGALLNINNQVQLDFSKQINIEMIHHNFFQYFIGALLLASTVSFIGFLITSITLSIFKSK